MSRIEKVHSITVTHLKGRTGRALVSAYGNVDWQGDRVMPGAFTKTIEDWEASGDPCPFIWSHAWADPFAHIGIVRKFTDTPRGLVVDFEIDDSTDFARQVAKLLDERRITKMSFAYDVVREAKASDGANELIELRMLECGPCLSPANEEAVLLSRKSVQRLLASEASGGRTWAGTTIPQKAVDDLRSKIAGDVEGFLDDLYETEMKTRGEEHVTQLDPEIARYNAEIAAIAGTPKSDADLIRQVNELAKTSTGVVTGATAAVLMTAANHLAEASVRASGAGLLDAVATLQGAARELRTIASGGVGDVEAILESVQPLIQELRSAGQTIAAGNLERTLAELAGGVGVEYVTEPKHRSDAELIAEVKRLFPSKPDQILGDAPRVDAQMRPVESAAAVPVDTDEQSFRLPVFETGRENWRLLEEETGRMEKE